MNRAHVVRMAVGRGNRPQAFDKLISFQFASDMLEIADGFSFVAPATRELWDRCQPDSEVEFWFDDVQVFSGFIDDRDIARRTGQIQVTGRDRGGRLLDESANLLTFNGETVESVARKIGVLDWFESVSFSNARNRRLLGGKVRRLARVAREPNIRKNEVVKKVDPGQSIADVMTDILHEARLLMWSSADGKELIIGKPNRDTQSAQWSFYLADEGSQRPSSPNIIDCQIHESVAERYSMITVCGASKGDSAKYGPNVTRRRATVFDTNETSDGTGFDFARRKRLLVQDDDVRSIAQAYDRALREQALRDSYGKTVTLELENWSAAPVAGGRPVFFHCDKVFHLRDELTGTDEDFFITRVDYMQSERAQACAVSALPITAEIELG